MRDHLGLRSLGKGALSLVHAQGEAASAEPASAACAPALSAAPKTRLRQQAGYKAKAHPDWVRGVMPAFRRGC